MQMNQLHETVISISVNMCTCKMVHASVINIYSTAKCGLTIVLAFFQYWQNILGEKVSYNHKTQMQMMGYEKDGFQII